MRWIRHKCRISRRITGHERSSRSHLVETCRPCSDRSPFLLRYFKEPDHERQSASVWGFRFLRFRADASGSASALQLSRSRRKSTACRPASIFGFLKAKRKFAQIESVVRPVASGNNCSLQLTKYCLTVQLYIHRICTFHSCSCDHGFPCIDSCNYVSLPICFRNHVED